MTLPSGSPPDAAGLQQEPLYESEERYRSLVRGAVVGIYRSTLDGRFLEVNPALVAMLGYDSEAELLATDLARDVYADPAERTRIIADVESRRVTDAEAETRWRRKDGTIITVRLRGRPITDERGAIEAFEMIAEDVTTRRLVEEQLRHVQKMEAVGRLAAGIAHDFNNLLTIVGGYTELVLASLAADDSRRADLDQVMAAARRAASLTRQLLAFGRKQIRQPHVIDLNALVGNMDQIVRRLVGDAVAVEIRQSATPALVEADPGQLEQAIINLAANARDAMPDGGRLTVAIAEVAVDDRAGRHAVLPAGRYVELVVSDTGTGMDEATRARLFDPFFTTKEFGCGSGLGLSTVYGIVDQNGGHIRVESARGRGTTFRIDFPRADSTAEAPRPVLTAPVPALSGTESILLVEDDAPVRSLVRQMLERQGYAVLEAASGADALKLADHHAGPIHLLLTDVVMPGMSGPALVTALLDRRPATRALLMSGYTDEQRLAAEEIARLPLIQKPFTTDALARHVRETLDAP